MRSLLFVPGDSERKLEKGLGSGADCLLVDLEDSVALDNKDRARVIAAGFLAARSGSTPIYARINDLRSGLAEADLAAIVKARPDGIVLPKAEGIADVEHLSARLRVAEAEAGLPDGGIAILPIVSETARGVFLAQSFAAGHGRLSGLTWGAEDLSAAIGASATRDAEGRYTDVFRLARTTTLLAAAAAHVAAIDTVFVDFRDETGLRDECVEAERDGFAGKMAIHPVQVPVINAAFTPSPEAVAEARALVDAFAAAGNPGVLGIAGKMVDRPHLRRAERLLARASTGSA
jgi:citrate lyase subunit beta/citryl-CoA lyase